VSPEVEELVLQAVKQSKAMLTAQETRRKWKTGDGDLYCIKL
jgi:hypothetical protein